MSVEIDWHKLTAGPDGVSLAETIRAFIHDKFQQVSLPRFIRSVQVHSFEFGDQVPTVVLKDICDPLPDFYEDDDEDEDEDGQDHESQIKDEAASVLASQKESLAERRNTTNRLTELATSSVPQLPRLQSHIGIVDHLASPLLSRAPTPGIPGGTSNLSYFHLPLSARLHGTATPLAAVAGGSAAPLSAPLHAQHPSLLGGRFQSTWPPHTQQFTSAGSPEDYNDPSTRPTTADSMARSHISDTFSGQTEQRPEPDPMDTQIVLHVAYDGNIKMSLTAEILLDYPMPSFVGIPLKLNVVGINFEGVALVAYLKKRAHFCFLSPEDAEILVGAENKIDAELNEDSQPQATEKLKESRLKMGDLLREIRVETEIGQKDGGKQVLKNVSKVERFVLEQVQRIFEEEFVYPSFWTFLV